MYKRPTNPPSTFEEGSHIFPTATPTLAALAPNLHINTMGNLCGKPSKESDPFSQPGRTVGSTPPSQSAPRAGVPKITGQGQTLGGSSAGDRDEARRAAARAAEVSAIPRHKAGLKSLSGCRNEQQKRISPKASLNGIWRNRGHRQE